jgi:hypothetical protein
MVANNRFRAPLRLVIVGLAALAMGACMERQPMPVSKEEPPPPPAGEPASAAAVFDDASTPSLVGPREDSSAAGGDSEAPDAAAPSDAPADLPPEGSSTEPPRTPDGPADEPPVDSEEASSVKPEAAAGETAADEPRRQVAGGASSAADRPLFEGWADPAFAIAFTGRQHGYIEPCGCTGLANQKGGLARRATLFRQIREQRGWPLAGMDVGNQVRRFGKQAELKFQFTVDGLQKMGYEVIGFGADDLRLSMLEIAALTADFEGEGTPFVSANVAVLERDLTPRFKIVELAGHQIGVTTVLGEKERELLQADEVISQPAQEGLGLVREALEAAACEQQILLAFASLEETQALIKEFPEYDLVVTSGGSEEPSYVPEAVEGSEALLIQVGAKGMHVGVVGYFPGQQPSPWRYERVPLDDRFADAPEMRELMAAYQGQLQSLGLEALGARAVPHPSGRQFLGSEVCSECHSTAASIWEDTPHAHALESLVHPGERSDVARHFDPECISCHVTGWNSQKHFPYTSGYLSLEGTSAMHGVGCENCHGPGSAHVAAEYGEVEADDARLEKLRGEMRLPLAAAEKKCMECHDLDNSPDFHAPGAFEKYWEQIVHEGKD